MLSEKKRRYFYETQLGKSKSVLFEQKSDNGLIYGFTENYVKVQTTFSEELINQIVPTKLKEIADTGHVKVSSLLTVG